MEKCVMGVIPEFLYKKCGGHGWNGVRDQPARSFPYFFYHGLKKERKREVPLPCIMTA